MRKAIKFTPRAREDIRKIWRYTLDQWSEDQADSYIRALNDKIQQLSAHPKLGKARRNCHGDQHQNLNLSSSHAIPPFHIAQSVA